MGVRFSGLKGLTAHNYSAMPTWHTAMLYLQSFPQPQTLDNAQHQISQLQQQARPQDHHVLPSVVRYSGGPCRC